MKKISLAVLLVITHALWGGSLSKVEASEYVPGDVGDPVEALPLPACLDESPECLAKWADVLFYHAATEYLCQHKDQDDPCHAQRVKLAEQRQQILLKLELHEAAIRRN